MTRHDDAPAPSESTPSESTPSESAPGESAPGEPTPDDDVIVSVDTVAPLSGATMSLPRATLAELKAAGVERPSIIRLMNDHGTPWPL